MFLFLSLPLYSLDFPLDDVGKKTAFLFVFVFISVTTMKWFLWKQRIVFKGDGNSFLKLMLCSVSGHS